MTFTTSIDVASLATRYRREASDDDIIRIHAAALGLLVDAAAVTFRTIPAEVADEMFLRVARSLWDGLRQANGGAQPTQVDGQTIARVARDALKEAEPLLGRYVVMGLA